MEFTANRRNELDIKNLELDLTSAPWAKKKINSSFFSNRCAFYSFCYWFSIKFLKRYLVSGFIASIY